MFAEIRKYFVTKGNEAVGDSLRAVTGWKGPIIRDGNRFVFWRRDGTAALEVDSAHAKDVHKRVAKKGGIFIVEHELPIRSTSNILARQYRP